MTDLYTVLRGRVAGLFGTRPGAAFIKGVIQPLDHFLYRASSGRLLFLNAFMPTLMLISTGAKSGQRRSVPLLYLRDGPRFVVLASNYGSASHPAWYHNLRANPACTVEVGGRAIACTAREAAGAEREELWRRANILYTGYRSYQASAGPRRIPVMVLEPAADTNAA